MRALLLSFLFVVFYYTGFCQQHYFKAQAHCHSTNSDGILTPVNVMYQYGVRGYRILFITDHGKMTDGESLSNPIMLCINSEELTFRNHVNAFGLQHRIYDDTLHIKSALELIHEQGALAMVNHPIPRYPNDWTLTCLEFSYLNYISFMEIYNGGTNLYAPDDHSLWDCVLTGGKKIYGLATDDSHNMNFVDLGWIMIKLSPDNITKESVLNALKNGDFYASNGIEITNYELVENNTINVSCSNCTRIRFVGPNHQTLQETEGTSASYTRHGELYVRAECEDDGMLVAKKMAWAQPEFFDKPASINENQQPTYIEVYPNPVQDQATISYYSTDGKPASLLITDITGKEIFSAGEIETFKGNNAYILNSASLSDGLYVCTVKVSGKSLNTKLVVRK